MDVKRSRGPFRWLTVASSEDPDGTELQLALNDDPAAEAYQQALFQQGQPAVMFSTGDVKGDYERIKARGSEFTRPPTRLTTSPGSVPWSSSSSRGGPSGTSPWPSVHAPDLSIARGRLFPWARSARNPRARSARSPLEGRHARRPTSVSIVTKESAEA
jgi:Glyoxalase/Bleomycin resistance protein/Dioxygenase superfamily